MNKGILARLGLVGFLAALAACNALVNFDPEGQPCDPAPPSPALECLTDAGYRCIAGVCTKGTGATDGGTQDGGQADGG